MVVCLKMLAVLITKLSLRLFSAKPESKQDHSRMYQGTVADATMRLCGKSSNFPNTELY